MSPGQGAPQEPLAEQGRTDPVIDELVTMLDDPPPGREKLDPPLGLLEEHHVAPDPLKELSLFHLEQTGVIDEAETAYRRVIALDPGGSLAERAEHRLTGISSGRFTGKDSAELREEAVGHLVEALKRRGLGIIGHFPRQRDKAPLSIALRIGLLNSPFVH